MANKLERPDHRVAMLPRAKDYSDGFNAYVVGVRHPRARNAEFLRGFLAARGLYARA